jgi:hypothetical protein
MHHFALIFSYPEGYIFMRSVCLSNVFGSLVG